jgi:hypothetical protein
MALSWNSRRARWAATGCILWLAVGCGDDGDGAGANGAGSTTTTSTGTSGNGSSSGSGVGGASSSGAAAGGASSSGAGGSTTSSTSSSSSGAGGSVSYKRVFVTSDFYASSQVATGGLDAACATAQAKANLPGTWIAWLSTDTTNAIDRLTSDGPWATMNDDTPVFMSKAAIASGALAPIDRDENGDVVMFGLDVWTGTASDGSASGKDCYSWGSGADTGTAGRLDLAGSSWTDASDLLCNGPFARVYCFEQ